MDDDDACGVQKTIDRWWFDAIPQPFAKITSARGVLFRYLCNTKTDMI